MTRDEIVHALILHRDEIVEAGEWRPLADHVLELLRMERRAAFVLFNRHMNEFVQNMKRDPASARETMKRHMIEAVEGR